MKRMMSGYSVRVMVSVVILSFILTGASFFANKAEARRKNIPVKSIPKKRIPKVKTIARRLRTTSARARTAAS